MKKIKLLLALTFVVIPWTAAQAEEQSLETEVIEKQLDPAKVADNGKTYIRLAEDKIFELDSTPDREAMREALGLKIPEKLQKQILAKGGSIEEVDPLAPFESMSEEQKVKFKNMRIHFLTNAARILNASKFALGAGSLVGDGFSFITVKVKKVFGKGGEQEPKEKRTFKERSHQVTEALLRGIDYKLWSQAPLVMESNEFGISVAAGFLAETGIMRRGAGGIEEVGINLGYNKSSKAFVFEIFHNSEKFDSTKGAFTVFGLVGKAGLMISRRNGSETQKGSAFYPPMLPAYSMTSSEYFTAGFSSSLGFPPPPFSDVMMYTNKFESHSLIRITVSPIVKGFVRMEVGDVKGSLKLFVMRFVDVFTAVTNKLRLHRRVACSAVFSQ
ncbi:hypothetical protein B9G69_012110 [Bdellovibrio sp. SKB1291214]|uniref:hypothetical protein n=1 Tax=Bdellovibrio sp. SKB1291214 TaxID=1732569 RepID=UPI000B51BB5E|nr:hypothetical protein [Bdellovibrio sp. SKB1291214]UYL07789.1 hypothetical protein B9G69_012110 [Bdellovibrio sp. SKB1291214]